MIATTAAVRRIGLLVPSSNTVVESEAPRLVPQDGSVSLHVSRFRVTTISNDPGSRDQFEAAAMLDAALLLADARVDVIAWAGTAASWLGTARDEALVREIESRSGIRATTAVLAINERLRELGARRIGLVTPYVAELESLIIANYRDAGIAVARAERLDLTVNTDYAAVTEETIAQMVRRAAAAQPDAIVVMCTNLRFGLGARGLSADLGLPVLDSVALTIEACLA